MKILFLTDNFPPETNAPATRTYEHARVWVRSGHDVTVVTCVPNFPRGETFVGYRNLPYQVETIDGIRVVRVWTYVASNEGFLRRTLDYVSFMVAATIASLPMSKPDLVVATSPQLFAAVAGWLVARSKRCPFVFELRDLWPESIAAVGAMRSGALLDRLERFARFLYRQADLMVPVTHSFADHLRDCGVQEERIEVVTNGVSIDSLFAERTGPETRAKHGLPQNGFLASYIGTHGLAHGLEAVLGAAKILEGAHDAHFLFVGEGADKAKLIARARSLELSNVTFLPAQARQEAMELLNAADASLVILRDDPLFRTVIPSKIFEAMALAKPIILSVPDGESADLVRRADCALVVPPGNAEALAEAIIDLSGDSARARQMGESGRGVAKADFDREALAQRMLAALLRTAEAGHEPKRAAR